MPSASAIEYAVAAVAEEIGRLPRPRPLSSDAQVLEALAGCVLSSRVRHDVTVASVGRLKGAGVFARPALFIDGGDTAISAILRERPLAHPRPRQMARWLLGSMQTLLRGGASIKQQLAATGDPWVSREWLVRECSGLGPKQASLFLRKAGCSEELAVLDSHVIRFMRAVGLKHCHMVLSRLRDYERTEEAFASYAASVGIEVARLDAAVWVVMRVASQGDVHDARDARIRWPRLNTHGNSVEGTGPQAVSAVC